MSIHDLLASEHVLIDDALNPSMHYFGFVSVYMHVLGLGGRRIGTALPRHKTSRGVKIPALHDFMLSLDYLSRLLLVL